MSAKTFYMMPSTMFNGSIKLTNTERNVYMLLLDRYQLSAKNGLSYVIYTREEMAKTLDVSLKTITKSTKRLEELGLITKKRQGLGKPNLIYINSFFCPFEKEKSSLQEREKGNRSKNDLSNTNYSSSCSNDRGEQTDDLKMIVKLIKDNDIKISSNSINQLDAYIAEYGIDYVMHIIEYCIDNNARSYRYIKNTLTKAIENGNTTIALFDMTIKTHQAKKQSVKQEQKEIHEKIKATYEKKEKVKEPTLDELVNNGSIDEDYLETLVETFTDMYKRYSGKNVILKDCQKIKLYKLDEEYGRHVIVTAVMNVRKSQKWLVKRDVDYLLNHIIDAYNNKYMDFDWQEDALDASNAYYSSLFADVQTEDINDMPEVLESPEMLEIGGVSLDTIDTVVGTETVEQVMFADNQEIKQTKRTQFDDCAPNYDIDLTNFTPVEDFRLLLKMKREEYDNYKLKETEYYKRKSVKQLA